MATEQPQDELVTALASMGVAQSKRGPQLAERLALLKAGASYERAIS